MQYDHKKIESHWQEYWRKEGTFKANNQSDKPKYYVLDMFPYPSGAGLHVGHPLGYIASDIYARYKRHKGFNVLHPQGYDSFGLPAEQYAIQTGQHPAVTTETNIATYRKQLDKIGFSFDWSREVRTSNPEYYKWTQWIFIQLFNSWYNTEADKAEDITSLVAIFQKEGNTTVKAVCDENVGFFSATEWSGFSLEKQQEILLQYRLTFLSDTEVNWCPALGTVLANDEIVNGVSERGGHPVVRKKMTQWSMRISAYAQRLLDGLEKLDWPQPLKDSQTNWIGRSQGAMVTFKVDGHDANIDVFTTRPDTIFGVSFMTLAPEHDLVSRIVTDDKKEEVEAYIEATAKRSERDRMADVKTISGAFTGAYALHPFTGEKIQIWIGDYVLASYGTGAVMAVPCGDERDYAFAKHFNIDILNIFENIDISEEAYTDKTSKTPLTNSDFLNGLTVKKAMKTVIYEMEQRGFGYGKINYRLRDAVFSRQRYWGEPFPVYYKNGLPQMIDAKHLPIVLPEVEKYLPTEDGKPPLGNADVWAWDTAKNEVVNNDKIDNETVFPLELNTMPGWAGSSWYFNRYMDANNPEAFASKEALDYWKEVDLYIGGSEHATGHLLYARFWQKFLFDKGIVPVDEFAKKLINQGMIQGTVESIYLEKSKGDFFTHHGKSKIITIPKDKVYSVFRSSNYETINFRLKELAPINITSDLVVKKGDNSFLKISGIKEFLKQNKEFEDSIFVTNEGFLICSEGKVFEYYNFENEKIADFSFIDELSVEFNFVTKSDIGKMSKRWRNVVNPDDICEEFGADSLRLFEMFLGPLEQSKPWKTSGISGVYSFLKKLWRLFYNGETLEISDAEPTKDELKTLHKTIKKVEEDIENFSFNTSVSTFMIAVNELTALKCNNKQVLESLLVLISPYAPHIAEELWSKLGNTTSISTAPFPIFEEKYLVESSKNYPISFNGKMRFTLELPLDMSKEDIEKAVMAYEKTQEQLQGRTPKKIIIVPGKIVNIVG